jgi:hypothetical protein
MEVGLQMVFSSYGWSGVSDGQVWDEELRLARLAAELGFDVLWSVEHHFNDYSFCPDNLQLMSYLAAVCPDVDLGTAAVILPWHDSLRVAEQVSVLDYLSRGRLRLVMGRGLARREFAAFRGTMDESRDRFDEAVALDRRYELPWDEARARREWGRMHVARGELREREQAREQLGQARALFERFGARGDVETMRESLARLA